VRLHPVQIALVNDFAVMQRHDAVCATHLDHIIEGELVTQAVLVAHLPGVLQIIEEGEFRPAAAPYIYHAVERQLVLKGPAVIGCDELVFVGDDFFFWRGKASHQAQFQACFRNLKFCHVGCLLKSQRPPVDGLWQSKLVAM